MLHIKIPGRELYNEKTNEFFEVADQVLVLEHSLVSLSKWESKWCEPFLSKEIKNLEKTIDYVRCMTITQNVDPNIYNCISNDIILEINNYIDLPMTATTFSKTNNTKSNREIITSEIIYYWMVTFNIPFECQKWHLNRLLTLINVCNIKNQPIKKMSRKEIFEHNRALNSARRNRINSRG